MSGNQMSEASGPGNFNDADMEQRQVYFPPGMAQSNAKPSQKQKPAVATDSSEAQPAGSCEGEEFSQQQVFSPPPSKSNSKDKKTAEKAAVEEEDEEWEEGEEEEGEEEEEEEGNE